MSMIRTAWMVGPVAMAVLASAIVVEVARPMPAEIARTPIGPGVIYQKLHLPFGPHGGGAVHVIEADISRPEIEIYSTPPNQAGTAWPFRLRHVWREAVDNDLIVAINGVMFTTELRELVLGREVYLPGDRARNNLPLVVNSTALAADGKHVLLWADREDQLHRDARGAGQWQTPPNARWAVAGALEFVHRGQRHEYTERLPGKVTPRTIIGIGPEPNQLWFIVFERADRALCAKTLAALGMYYAINVDGGGSSCFVVGEAADSLQAGTYTGGMRPVATTIGLRFRR